MNRIAFFAHYDPDGIVEDYVLHYLAGLIDSGVDCVLFASDCDLRTAEVDKLPAGVKVVHASRHGEYDFGSWKRCLATLSQSELARFDELILCNDSCYGPLFSLAPMFAHMEKVECDYWGVTQVRYWGGYYPSYFLVVRSKVLNDPDFGTFLKNVEQFSNKEDYCRRYEVGLNRFLEKQGYAGGCYLEQYKHLCHSSPDALTADAFAAGLPFIRVMTARGNPGGIAHLGKKIEALTFKYRYPYEFIMNHLERTFPEYRKFWSFFIQDIDKKILGIFYIRLKNYPDRKRIRLKVRIFSFTIFYCKFPICYAKSNYPIK